MPSVRHLESVALRASADKKATRIRHPCTPRGSEACLIACAESQGFSGRFSSPAIDNRAGPAVVLHRCSCQNLDKAQQH